MRFLLFATIKNIKTCKKVSLTLPRVKNPSLEQHQYRQQSLQLQQSQQFAWGQQCSPKCGCVLRLECHTDKTTHIITSATYHAKRVVATLPQHNNNKTTTTTTTPLMVECTCHTLHTLANHVVQHILHKPMAAVQQTTEFTHVRSSLALQHAVLTTQKLTTTDTTCFDLVEDALVAMTKGHFPASRPTKHLTFTEALSQRYQIPPDSNDNNDNNDDDHDNDNNEPIEEVTRYGRALRRGLQLTSSPSEHDTPFSVMTPRAMSALTLMDWNWHVQEQQTRTLPSITTTTISTTTMTMDWEAYVDELYHDVQMA